MAAGKVSGPGGTPPSDLPIAGKAGKVESSAPGGPRFADKLESTAASARASGATPTKVSAESSGVTSDLAAELGAGKITAKAAIDRVIDRVVDKQVGVNAPAAVREKVRAALETAVADDPLLSEKIKTLGS